MPVSKTYTFSPSTTIASAEVNQNFDDCITGINAMIPQANLLDEDNMATNSATKPPSQQSTKAYIDNSGGGATPYKFRAYGTDSIAYSGGYLVFAEIFDPNNNYNASTGVYTAPVSGYYLVTAHARFTDTGDAYTCYIRIYVNGNIYSYGYSYNGYTGSVATTVGANLADIVYAEAGHEIKLYVVHDNEGHNTATISGHFSAHLLSV